MNINESNNIGNENIGVIVIMNNANNNNKLISMKKCDIMEMKANNM